MGPNNIAVLSEFGVARIKEQVYKPIDVSAGIELAYAWSVSVVVLLKNLGS